MKPRLRYMTVIWRGVRSVRARIYRGTKRKELFCPDLRQGSPWVGVMRFVVTVRGRQNYRYRSPSTMPLHMRRLGALS